MKTSAKMLCCLVFLTIGASASAAGRERAIEWARNHIASNPAAIKATKGDEFIVRDVIVDADGTEHVRFDRAFRGLPVIGGDVVVHSRGGRFLGSNFTLRSTVRPSLRPRVKGDEAIVIAGAEFGTRFEGMPTASLVIYARGTTPVLAYDVRFQGTKPDLSPVDMHYIVDAASGRLLDKWSAIHNASASGTGNTLYSGTVPLTTNSITGGFELRDPTRGNSFTINGAIGRTSGKIYTDSDNVWGNYAMSDTATAAADAQYGLAVTWDYFKLVHNRNGIANDGRGTYNRVHYGRNFVNAYWSDSCFCMTYGDGDGVNYGPLVALDIAGHEMTHGVTSRTADLIYSGESGGLNEATSDIFGAMVEFYANNASDPGDYLVGEKIYLQYPAGNRALRYMYDPSKDGASPNCYYAGIGSLDVHYSSGVANRFFYLLAEGSGSKSFNGVDHTAPTCNGGSVTGIGRDKAGRIWYRALTVYMTSSTNYAGARAATLSAASDLYGGGSAEYAAVQAAWNAVSVGP